MIARELAAKLKRDVDARAKKKAAQMSPEATEDSRSNPGAAKKAPKPKAATAPKPTVSPKNAGTAPKGDASLPISPKAAEKVLSGSASKQSNMSKNSQRDMNNMYSEYQSEKPPAATEISLSPFHVFAIIDGHRGHQVAEFIRNHLMDIIVRNFNIMVRRYFSIGLK